MRRNKEVENKEFEKIDPDFPYFRVVLIVVSFLLGLLDMTFLYQAIDNITGIGGAASMIAAFAIAELANFTAFMMGEENGRNMAKRAINKKVALLFAFWIFIGIVYAGIRVASFVSRMNDVDFNLYGEIFQFCILAISYIGTGTTIWSSARVIFDKRAHDYRKAKKDFELSKANLDSSFAKLQASYSSIIHYDANYKSLDVMRKNIEDNIELSEKATMESLGGKVLNAHPEANPLYIRQIIEKTLAERKENK